jgi:DNA-binding GntR family transcriptional regulator
VGSAGRPIRRENRIVPLYHQVQQVIRYRISTRQYGTGMQIPSEHELGKELKVSRVTVREALRELVRENLLVKGEPFSFTVNWLPPEIGRKIDPQSLYTTPLNTIIERDLKIPIVRAEETVEAAPANPEVAEQLGVPVLYPVMHVTRVMFTEGDRAFEIVETSYRADKYQYSVHLTRVKRDGKWTWSHDPEKPPAARNASKRHRSRA